MHYVHALNRGTDKRAITQDARDKLRFVSSLYLMNDKRHIENTARTAVFEVEPRTDERERLVTVHAWCLMDNHYHLLLSENTKHGVSAFLKKLNVGYTGYFNLKYDRSGVLFQGRTKQVPITTDRHFLYILPYIHLNPLDLHQSTRAWRTQCLTDQLGALKKTANYRWSSLRNYLGVDEFSSILAGSELFADRKTHVVAVRNFLTEAPSQDLDSSAFE